MHPPYVADIPKGGLSRRLESLTLTGNKLPALPVDVGECSKLKMLYAGANGISDFTPALSCPGLLHAARAEEVQVEIKSSA